VAPVSASTTAVPAQPARPDPILFNGVSEWAACY
jgi:hypothetical protein